MQMKSWMGAALLGAGAFAVVVTSNVNSLTAAPGPSPVTVTNGSANPVPVTGQVQVHDGAGFSAQASAVEGGAELSLFVEGPRADGRFDAMVLENASLRVQAPAGHVVTALVQIYPPSGEFDDRVVSHLPLVPQGTFGIFAVYSANVPLRLYSVPEPGSFVNFVISCGGCDASDNVRAEVAVSGRAQ